ncbi:hypothetical protein HYW44_01480 [Candidatus Daviesbacteria bacterium]|nr:hypothetical protein [Candidatus Daviesbacteria bacterium]
MVGITELGLLFIGAAWFVQVFDITKTEAKLNKQFVLLYVLGVALMLLEGIANNSKTTNLLNLLSLLGALIVYFKLK